MEAIDQQVHLGVQVLLRAVIALASSGGETPAHLLLQPLAVAPHQQGRRRGLPGDVACNVPGLGPSRQLKPLRLRRAGQGTAQLRQLQSLTPQLLPDLRQARLGRVGHRRHEQRQQRGWAWAAGGIGRMLPPTTRPSLELR